MIWVPRKSIIVPRRKQGGWMGFYAAGAMGTGGGGGDPYLANVVSLLNFEGTDGSTTFIDATGKLWTPSGNAQIDTSQGWNAGLFDGNDRISTPNHADWDFGSGLWTLEIWLFPLTVSGFQNFLRKDVAVDWSPFSIALDGDKLRTRIALPSVNSWAVDQTSVISLSTNALTHVAAVRDSGNMFRQYVGGVQSGATSFSTAMRVNTASVHLGALGDNTAGYNGLVRAFRATKGVCRYPGGTTFNPPAAPFPTS